MEILLDLEERASATGVKNARGHFDRPAARRHRTTKWRPSLHHGVPQSEVKGLPPQGGEATMNYAADIAEAPSNDRLLGQLQNVFRILAKPDSELREKAQKLRQEISCTWRNQAAHGKWFPWPTTVACRVGRGLRGVDWRPQGMLGILGYHVGETQPTRQEIRRCILEYAFECDLPPVNDPAYHEEWGEPRTAHMCA
jgi:hypothetical protein